MRREHRNGNESGRDLSEHAPVGHLPPTGRSGPPETASTPPRPPADLREPAPSHHSPATPPPTPLRSTGTVGPRDQPKKRRRGVVIGVLSAIAAVATTAEMTIGGISFLASLGSSDNDEPEFETVADVVGPHTLQGIEPALAAVSDEIGEAPVLWDLRVYPERLLVTIQVPDNPDLLDEYTWEDNELSRPTPTDHNLADPDRLPEFLFGAEDIATDAMTAAIEDVPSQHPDRADQPEAELAPSVLRFEKDVVVDAIDEPPQLTVAIHADDNVVDSGRSWIVNYDLDGELVSSWESGDSDDETAGN